MPSLAGASSRACGRWHMVRVEVPLKYMYRPAMYRPAMQMLKGREMYPTQTAASIGFQPGVEVNYPGYMPAGDPRAEGSDSMEFEPWARNAEMRKRAGWDVGETGWEPGPDYYSTVRTYIHIIHIHTFYIATCMLV